MQTANKPENNNNSHEAHPSLGKAHKPMTDAEWHKNMRAHFPDVKPIGIEPCLFVKNQK